MHLIDGKTLAEEIRTKLKQEIEAKHLSPCLAILLVGEDPASHLYVGLKRKAAEQIGVQGDIHHLPPETPDQTLIDLVRTWNQDERIHGILIQVPLPPAHNEEKILSSINPKKDADGFHPDQTSLIPPVHEGILRLISEAPFSLNGMSTVIIVNSQTFALPLERLLKLAGASVTVLLPDELEQGRLAEAELIVIAIGRLFFLHSSMTPTAKIIIDVGTNKTSAGLVRGDVDIQSYEKKEVWITPVPGGVGPMTIAHLLKNVVQLAEK